MVQYLPDLNRALAAQEIPNGLPWRFISLSCEQTCARGETLRHLFRSLMGWKCLPAGLAWWDVADTHNARFTLMDQDLPRWRSHQQTLNQLPNRHESWETLSETRPLGANCVGIHDLDELMVVRPVAFDHRAGWCLPLFAPSGCRRQFPVVREDKDDASLPQFLQVYRDFSSPS